MTQGLPYKDAKALRFAVHSGPGLPHSKVGWDSRLAAKVAAEWW
jgi:hypothetical protein